MKDVLRHQHDKNRSRGGGGHFLIRGYYWGCALWMGSHFQDWTDYHGVAFSTELVEWGGTFSEFWGKTVNNYWTRLSKIL